MFPAVITANAMSSIAQMLVNSGKVARQPAQITDYHHRRWAGDMFSRFDSNRDKKLSGGELSGFATMLNSIYPVQNTNLGGSNLMSLLSLGNGLGRR